MSAFGPGQALKFALQAGQRGVAGAAAPLAQWLLQLEAQRYARTGASNTTLASLQREFQRLAWPKSPDT